MIGSVPVQTVIGGSDSRLVIKVGSIIGKTEIDDMNGSDQGALLSDDFLNFNISLSAFQVTLIDTQLKTSVAQLSLKSLKAKYKKAFNASEDRSLIEYSEFSFSLRNMTLTDCKLSKYQIYSIINTNLNV